MDDLEMTQNFAKGQEVARALAKMNEGREENSPSINPDISLSRNIFFLRFVLASANF